MGAIRSEPLSAIVIVSVRSTRKPGSTRWTPRKLRSMRPAPTRSITASAISATTSAPCARACPRPAGSRPALLRPSPSEPFGARAGARPLSRPVSSETPSEIHSTLPSTATASRRGMFGAARPRTMSKLQVDSRSPAAPPMRARARLSTNRSLAMRLRVAPIARRIAISRCRTAPRASSRLATFAHATSSTNPTAAASNRRAGLTGPTTGSCKGSTVAPTPAFDSGCASSSACACASTSARATSSDTPGLKRPKARR